MFGKNRLSVRYAVRETLKGILPLLVICFVIFGNKHDTKYFHKALLGIC
jgi:hypothetical protein